MSSPFLGVIFVVLLSFNVQTFSLEDINPVFQLGAHQMAALPSVMDAVTSGDGKWAATATSDFGLTVWEINRGIFKAGFELPYEDKAFNKVRGMALNGRYLAVLDDTNVSLFDFTKRKFFKKLAFQNQGRLRSMTTSRDGTFIALTFEDGVQLFDFRSGEYLHTFQNNFLGFFSAAGLSADGNTLVTAQSNGGDQLTVIWSVPLKKPVNQFRQDEFGEVKQIEFSPSENQFAWTFQAPGKIGIFDAEAPGKQARYIDINSLYPLSLGYLDGRQLGVICKGGFVDTAARKIRPGLPLTMKMFPLGSNRFLSFGNETSVVSAPDFKRVPSIHHGHPTKVTSLTFSPDGRALVSVDSEDRKKIWDLEKRDFQQDVSLPENFTYPTSTVSHLGNQVVFGSARGFQQYDLATQKKVEGIEKEDFQPTLISPNGKWKLLLNERTYSGSIPLSSITYWTRPEQTKTLYGDFYPLKIKFHPTLGNVVAIPYKSDEIRTHNEIRWFDLITGSKLKTFPVDTITEDLEFSRDGKYQIILANKTIQVWDENHAVKIIRSVRGNRIARHPESDSIVVSYGDSDGSIQVWDIETGQLLRSQLTYQGPITAAAFSPDGSWLATAGLDTTISLWFSVFLAYGNP